MSNRIVLPARGGIYALTQPLACSHSTTCMLSRNHLHALSQGVRSGEAVSQERIPPRSPLHQSWRPHQHRSSCSISRDLLASAHCCYFLLTHPFQRRTGIIIIYQSPCSADTEGDGERRERGPNRGGEEQGLTARAWWRTAGGNYSQQQQQQLEECIHVYVNKSEHRSQ